MGVLFQRNERHDFVPMIEEIAQGVEDLGFAQTQCQGDLLNCFPALVKRSDVPDGDAQAVDDRFAPAHSFEAENMWVICFYCGRQVRCSIKATELTSSVPS